jgi:hypothetical protein
VTCGIDSVPANLVTMMDTLPIHVRIERAQRLLQMMEQDAPLLAIRIAELTPDHQQAAIEHASRLSACARAQLEKLRKERHSAEQ